MIGKFLLRCLYRYAPLSIYDFLVKNITIRGIILDAGGGSGGVLKALELRNMHHTIEGYILLDPDIGLLRIARYRRSILLDIIAGIAECPPLRSNVIDNIIIHDALHHFKEPATALASLTKLLREDGSLIIVDYDRSYSFVKVLVLIEKLIGFPSNFLKLGELIKLLKNIGLRVNKLLGGYNFLLIANKNRPMD